MRGRHGGRGGVYISGPGMMTSVWICYGELYSQLYSVCLVETKYSETNPQLYQLQKKIILFKRVDLVL
jgi:hypothetical protein